MDLIPVEIDIALAFPIDLAEKFSDDAVFFTEGASGAGFTSLDLIPVETNVALAMFKDDRGLKFRKFDGSNKI
jgi:hypothetical protein